MLDQDALRALQTLIGGNRADLVELVQEFLEDAPSQLAAMTAAAAAHDIERIRHSAHTLKSNSRDLGATALAAACAALEAEAATSPRIADLAPKVQAITLLWSHVEKALVAEISGSGAAS